LLDATLKKSIGALEVSVELTVRKGVLALVGPNGCGKTTTLDMLAGLTSPDSGSLVLDQTVLFDSEKGVNVPPEERNVGYIFQNYALFPHMSVHENVAFGLKMRKVRGTVADERVSEVLELLHITQLKSKRPSQLSGGEGQKVALARVLVLTPRLLLCDEPFSALDHTAKDIARCELKRVLKELDIPAVLVSHDPEEVSSLADSVCVMRGGTVAQHYSNTVLQRAHGELLEKGESV